MVVVSAGILLAIDIQSKVKELTLCQALQELDELLVLHDGRIHKGYTPRIQKQEPGLIQVRVTVTPPEAGRVEAREAGGLKRVVLFKKSGRNYFTFNAGHGGALFFSPAPARVG